MATWSDQRLAGHKRAQSYLSATGATAGLGALGAVALKNKKAATLISRGTYAVGRKLTGGQLLPTTRRVRAGQRLNQIQPGNIRTAAGKAQTGLLTAGAGIGGIGGYNFAAVQSQEARRNRGVRKNMSGGVSDFGTFGVIGTSVEISKAYDPERKRRRRLEVYRDASFAAGGVGVGTGTVLGARALRGAVQVQRGPGGGNATPRQRVWTKMTGRPAGGKGKITGLNATPVKLKPVGRAGAITAAGIGSLVAGQQLDKYRKNSGRSYKALRG